jgi:hypothetical protein
LVPVHRQLPFSAYLDPAGEKEQSQAHPALKVSVPPVTRPPKAAEVQ